MPVRSLVDGWCAIKIFEAEGFAARYSKSRHRAVLEKPGVLTAIIVCPEMRYGISVIGDWLEHAAITLERFDELRMKFCPP
jgi:hypothetical protein